MEFHEIEVLIMITEKIYKCPNGKLLRLKYNLDDDVIISIKISGDFFLHPEEKIELIENSIIGIKTSEIKSVLEKIIKENNIQIIGFTPEDVEFCLNNN